MAENNKDGYVQHANVGRRSIIDIDEANSNFEVAGDKITGIVKGSITKEYQGNTDNFQLNLNNIPFIGGGGSGGGSGVETLVVTGEASSNPTNPSFTVTNTSMTFDELEAAILDGKTVLCVVNAIGSQAGFNQVEPIGILSYEIGPIAHDNPALALFEIRGSSNASYMKIGPTGDKIAIYYTQLSWHRGYDLPTVNMKTYNVVSTPDSSGGGAL